MDDTQLKDFLSNIHIGDYIWMKYDGGLFRRRVKEAKGYVVQIDNRGVFLDDVDPFEKGRHFYHESFSYKFILEFKKLRESSIFGIESKVDDVKV